MIVWAVIQIFNSEEYMMYGLYSSAEKAQDKIDSLRFGYNERDDLEIRRLVIDQDLKI